MPDPKPLSPGQLIYEQKQAKKAGKTLDVWLAAKQKRATEGAKPATPPPPPKPPGLISRLLDRAHKPLKPK